jgi:hypothetical protein
VFWNQNRSHGKVRPTSRHAMAPLAVVGYPEIFAVWKLAPPLFLRIVFE